MRPSIKYGLIALGLSALVITVAVLGPRFEQKALAQANTVKQKTLVISAFRENGPNGAGDEFVEIFNPSNAEVTVSTLSGDGNGIGVFSNAGNNAGTTNNTVTLRCNIPGATVIKGRGWFLCGGSGYSLGNLGRNGGSAHSVPDATIIGDIPNDAGLALMNVGADTVTFVPLVGFVSGLLPTTVFDKVGFRPYGPNAPASGQYPTTASQYCEGTCLQPVGDASTVLSAPGDACPAAVGPASDPAAFPVQAGGSIGTTPICYGESGQYKIDRRRSAQQFDPSAGNLHRDTDNNADDFILDAPNPVTGTVGQTITGVAGISSVLGAAGPHNISAPPIIGPPIHTDSRFDPGVANLTPPNAERRSTTTLANPQNDPAGTFILRRRFTNTSGSTSGARYRIDDLTTLCGGQAGTNGINSNVATQEARNLRGPDFTTSPAVAPTPTCQGEGSDSSLFTAILKAVNHPQETVRDSTNTFQTVLGTVLEDTTVTAAGTPAVGRHQPFGGGSNSSYVATTATTVTGDGVNGGAGSFAAITGPQGTVFRIAFKFGVVRSGRFKLLIGPEVATTATPAP